MKSPIILPPIPAHFPPPLISSLVHMMSISCLNFCSSLLIILPIFSLAPQIYLLLYSQRDLFKNKIWSNSCYSILHSPHSPIKLFTIFPVLLGWRRDQKPSHDQMHGFVHFLSQCTPATLNFFSSTSVSPSCKGPFYVVVSLPRRLTYFYPFTWINYQLSIITSWRKTSLVGSVPLI